MVGNEGKDVCKRQIAVFSVEHAALTQNRLQLVAEVIVAEGIVKSRNAELCLKKPETAFDARTTMTEAKCMHQMGTRSLTEAGST